MPKTKRYREARELQQQGGGAYTDALRRSDEQHEREKADRRGGGTAGSKFSEIRGLTNHLRSILAALDAGKAFVPEPPPASYEVRFGKGPGVVVDRRWAMDLMATSRLLAEHVGFVPPTLHSNGTEFSWTTPSNIEDEHWVTFARNLAGVLTDIVKAVDVAPAT